MVSTKQIVIGISVVLLVIWLVYASKRSSTLTLSFGGDVMIGRTVAEVIAVKGYRYPLEKVVPLLSKSEVRIANLETTLTTSVHLVPKVFNFKAPPEAVDLLRYAGFDVVNLANNHSLDFSVEGLRETIATLDAAHIKHVGAGASVREAQEPVIIEKQGIRIGIMGCTDNEPTWLATESTSGTNYVRVGDVATVEPLIRALRKKVDIVIVTTHWGPNMRAQPSDDFVAFAHQLIDLGVDIIHGHSAHVVQGVELYANKVIMYDTGDFIDDYAIDPIMRNDRSFLFNVEVDKNGPRRVTMVPLLIDNMQVAQATGDEARAIVRVMQERCTALGTRTEEQEGNLVITIRR